MGFTLFQHEKFLSCRLMTYTALPQLAELLLTYFNSRRYKELESYSSPGAMRFVTGQN